jgi:hypothetical protein
LTGNSEKRGVSSGDHRLDSSFTNQENLLRQKLLTRNAKYREKVSER